MSNDDRPGQNPLDVISTGIDEIDELLGGGIQGGSIVLVKGGPGTGKTTLCSQIMAEAVRAEKNCVYVCIEDTPGTALLKVHRCFDRVGVERMASRIRVLGCNDVIKNCFGTPDVDLDEAMRRFWAEVFGHKDGAVSFAVVDSQNALVEAVANSRPGRFSNRQILFNLINEYNDRAYRQQLNWPRGALYLISEQEAAGPPHAEDESYIADVVIELSRDSIGPDSGLRKEYHFFARVTKARGRPNQRRRCCYDFTPEGVKFYPTFAADGLVSLFWENQPQLDAIASLESVDIPALFPSLKVERFTRSGLQTVFSVRRRSLDVPGRTPMFLHHLDEYWVKYFLEQDDGPEPPRPLLQPIDAAKLSLYTSTPRECGVIEELRRKGWYVKDGYYNAVPHLANIGLLVYRSDLLDSVDEKPPRTFEDVSRICKALKGTGKNKFLIETQTYDSFMATVFELMWNHGAVFRARKKASGRTQEVEWLVGGREAALEAMRRLQGWAFSEKIIPPNSSVDPADYPNDDWVFARHWYSTLIDLLFRRDPESGRLCPREVPNVDLSKVRVCPLPVSKAYLKKHPRTIPGTGGVKPLHHSAWGEWCLAVQGGTENIKLSIDLINSLMSSRKVVESAITGAGLPTVDRFYDRYGSAQCPGTGRTFSEVRAEFFPSALSRTIHENYPRVARILYGACLAIVGTPLSEPELKDVFYGALDEIEADRD